MIIQVLPSRLRELQRNIPAVRPRRCAPYCQSQSPFRHPYAICQTHRSGLQIPENLTFDQASTIPLGFTTAAIGLYQEKREYGGAGLVAPWADGGRGKYAGQAIYIPGGSSSVGQYGESPLRSGSMMTLKIAPSIATGKTQWIQPNHYYSVSTKRRLLPCCGCYSCHRLSHDSVRFGSSCCQGDSKGTCGSYLRRHFDARITEGRLGDLGA